MTGTDPRRRRIRRALVRPVARFIAVEASSGILLFAAAVVAVLWANGPLRDTYHDLWRTHLTLAPGVRESLEAWVNDGLMVIFFFVVGLEVKRELVTGELADRRAATLPVVAAVGGMAVPALVYLAMSPEHASRGWGIPVATDIAFAVGVLTLLGPRVPSALKVFLLTLAVADDIGGILVIAAFYTDHLSFGWFTAAVGGLAVVVVLRRAHVVSYVPYVVVGVVVWYATLRSGVHATLAGVALGFLTPARPVKGREVLTTLEDRLHPWSSYLVIPVFALANAGVEVGAGALRDAFGSGVTWGVVLGLVAGKTVGITAATVGACRAGLCRLPPGLTTAHVVGAAMVGGIGFTVALFIANLAFAGEAALLEDAKMGVLVGSLVSGLAGAAWLAVVGQQREGEQARAD